jgi:hypothetical protein
MRAELSVQVEVPQMNRADWPEFEIHHGFYISEHVETARFSNRAFSTLDLAMSALIYLNKATPKYCSGVTLDADGCYTLRRGTIPYHSPDGTDISWILTDALKPAVKMDMQAPIYPIDCGYDFELFVGMYIPGYPLALDSEFPRAFKKLEPALEFCRINPDLCTGVTFSPALDVRPYSIRSSGTLVPSAAGERSWMHKGFVRRGLLLYSQKEAITTKNKRPRYNLIDSPSFEVEKFGEYV